MIGTGIYLTPSAILAGTGSVGLSMIYWILGALISLCSAAVYLGGTPPYQELILLIKCCRSAKFITLIFIAVTGFVVLGGHTKVQSPTANFDNAFQGSATPYRLTNALYRTIFSDGDYNNAFNVVNEIWIKRNGTIAILVVMTLYVFANVAFIAAVGKEKLESLGTIAASLFFTVLFGSCNAAKGLDFLFALSSFGNMIAVMIGAARMLRQCGRQDVLPETRFWVSTWLFGKPAGPYMLDWALSVVIILAIPTGDAFNFVSGLAVLPNSVFNLAMAVGLYTVRWRRKKANLPRPSFKAWRPVVIFNILVQLYLVVMPWYPPAGDKGDVLFWYGTYMVSGLGIVLLCEPITCFGFRCSLAGKDTGFGKESYNSATALKHIISPRAPSIKLKNGTGRMIENQSSQQSAERFITGIAGEKPA
ncbi:putative high affinity methionine permease protein [Seiridium cardinale]|uniref:High affinity methionine permease protein n=1 Tax=Seiridium cardinale TaxID=138064 RepID=A0ABR2XH94_9PEZI